MNWAKIRELFEHALQLPREEREGFLQGQEAGQEELDEILTLLCAADREEADGLLASLGPSDNSSTCIDIPGYAISRSISTGGMGSVHLATRLDTGNRVAIKLIRPDRTSPESTQRFRRESGLLERVKHPNIAMLQTSGVTPCGDPFLVMEYVSGKDIVCYCDEHGLSTRERVRLVLQLCDAAACVHAHAIVHRDIKPSNILVTEAGTLKLLDFGIAKLINADAIAPAEATETRNRAFSLKYASPEQIKREPAAPSMDIYALGVVLYELLARSHPHVHCMEDPFALQCAIVDELPVLPSVAVRRSAHGLEADRLSQALRGDLDRITMHALAKEPRQRYGTVAELRADLANYLNDLPVSARPSTWRYRAGKFVRRHPVSSGMLGAGIVGVLIGLLVAIWGWRVERSARMRVETMYKVAQRESQCADIVETFMNKCLLESAGELRATGEPVTVRAVLDRFADRVDGAFPGFPHVEAELRETIGTLYMSLGEFASAQPQQAAAVRIREATDGPLHERTLAAKLNLGGILLELNQYAEAERHVREVLAAENQRGDKGNVAVARHTLAQILRACGRYDEAERVLREALDQFPRTAGTEGVVLAMQFQLAQVIRARGKHVEAAGMYERVLENMRAVFGDGHRHTAACMGDLASLYDGLGQVERAEQLQRAALDLTRRVLGERHPETLVCQLDLADVFCQTGRLAEAERLCRDVLKQRRDRFGELHTSTLHAKHRLGCVLVAMGHAQEGRALLEQVLIERRSRLGEDHPHTIASKCQVGIATMRVGDLEAAHEMLMEAWGRAKAILGPASPQSLNAERAYAEVLMRMGADAAALDVVGDVVARAEGSSQAPAYQAAVFLRAQILNKLGRVQEAHRLFTLTLETCRQNHNEYRAATVMKEMVQTCEAMGELDEARSLLESALAVFVERLGTEHVLTQRAAEELARLSGTLGESED